MTERKVDKEHGPNIRWSQKDLDETVLAIYEYVQKEINNTLPIIGKATAKWVKEKATDPLTNDLKKLEKRIAELEKIPQLKYCGVFSPKLMYVTNNLVSHAGSMWICKVEQTFKWPGASNTDWQLVVKRGKDGERMIA